jgi:hypothetical protein
MAHHMPKAPRPETFRTYLHKWKDKGVLKKRKKVHSVLEEAILVVSQAGGKPKQS